MHKSLGQQMLDITRITLFLFTGAFYMGQLISGDINTDFWPSLFCFLFMVWFDIACGIKNDIYYLHTRIMVAGEFTISVLALITIIVLNGNNCNNAISTTAVVGVLLLFGIKIGRFIMSLMLFVKGDTLPLPTRRN